MSTKRRPRKTGPSQAGITTQPLDAVPADAPPTSAIDQFIAGPRTPDAVAGFLRAHSFPIVEGPAITFVYHGAADAVHLKHWVYGLPQSQSLARVDGTDLWFLKLTLPPSSRVEYKLEVVRHGHGEWMEDPLNKNRARDPFGANSVAHGSGYQVPSWIHLDPASRQGVLDEIYFDSPTFGRRGYRLYVPARFRRTRRYPLLVVHDGHDYLHYTGMASILDNLMHRLEIPDLVVAFISSPNRLGEYADDPRHARYLTDELVPHLERRLPLEARPQGRCLMGASFGAVASLSAAWRRPGFYGRLLLQSGSFAFADIGERNHRGPLFDPIVQFVNQLRSAPVAVSERVFMSCGTYESLIYENRSLAPVLEATGMDVRYVEARDGHNWENWRDRLRDGLSWLFPGPLLLVYE